MGNIAEGAPRAVVYVLSTDLQQGKADVCPGVGQGRTAECAFVLSKGPIIEGRGGQESHSVDCTERQYVS